MRYHLVLARTRPPGTFLHHGRTYFPTSCLRRTVSIPVALLILLAIILAIEILTLTQSLRLVDHADQVISNARQAMRYMADMESSARGFELTGDERFLKTFKNARVATAQQR